jgi:sarcosine oxidase subunit gamma
MGDVTMTLSRPSRQYSLRVAPAARRRVAAAAGLSDLPEPNTVVATQGARVAWLRPDEWLVIVGARDDAVATRLRQAVLDADSALIDVSHARVSVMVSGAGAADVLSSACAIDLHSQVFRVGMCAQTVFGHAPVLVIPVSDGRAYELLVRPSMADYVRLLLEDAREAS